MALRLAYAVMAQGSLIAGLSEVECHLGLLYVSRVVGKFFLVHTVALLRTQPALCPLAPWRLPEMKALVRTLDMSIFCTSIGTHMGHSLSDMTIWR